MMKRKLKLLFILAIFCIGFFVRSNAQTNLALSATASTSFVSGWESLAGVNNGITPSNSGDRNGGIYGNWNNPNKIEWIEYDWPQEFKFSSTEVYWFTDNGGILIPTIAYIEYWDGTSWVNAGDIGVAKDKFNVLTLPDIVTSKLRISMLNPDQSTGIIEWKAIGRENLPNTDWTGGPYTLDGISQSVSVSTGILSTATDFAVSAWVKQDTLVNGSRIFDFGKSGDKYMYLTGKGTNNNVQFAITTAGSAGEQYIDGSANKPLSVGIWQHIVIVKSGNTGVIYLNGIEIGRNSALALGLADLGGLTSNFIGKSQKNDLFFGGQITEFNVFVSALTSMQVNNLIKIKKPSNPKPANAWFIVSNSSDKRLSWDVGNYQTASNVYIGTSLDNVTNSTSPTVSGLDSKINSIDIPVALTEGQIYYWRVDEVNGTEVRKGDIWKFKYMSPNIKVFLMGGQSNMTGFTPLSEITADLKHEYPEAIIWVDGQAPTGLERKWMNLTAGFGHSTTVFGPELGFGPEIAKDLPNENIALLKCSWGGTNLVFDWRPPSSGKATGDLYKKFIKSVHDGIAAMPAGLKPEIAGMLWMQGEYDANNTKQAAVEYESNLTNLINDLRAEFKVPHMPFIIAQISEASAWAAFGSTIRQAQLNVSKNVPYTSMVITSDYGFTDGLHYNGPGEISLGKRFATSYSNIMESKKGLKVQYFDTNELINPKSEKIDSLIDFNWGNTTPDPSISGDNYSVRWSGFIQSKTTDVVKFYIETGNGVRLKVDNITLADNWNNNTKNSFSGDIVMKAGVYYPIEIEFVKNSVDASLKLEWSSKGTTKSMIPSTALFQNPLFSLDKTGWTIKSVDNQTNSTQTGGAVGVLDRSSFPA
jgi:hypothetical protein